MSTPNDAVIEYWLLSRYTGEISLEELDLTGEEWDNMRNEDKNELVRELVFGQSEWGYRIK